jgi:dynein heavy chain
VATIQQALKAKDKRFMFEGIDLALRWSCASFITVRGQSLQIFFVF